MGAPPRRDGPGQVADGEVLAPHSPGIGPRVHATERATALSRLLKPLPTALALLIVLAWLAVPGRARLVGVLEAAVQAQTGYGLALRGDLGLAHLTRPTLIAHDLDLTGTPNIGDGSLVQVGRVEIELSPWPLLRGRLEPTRVRLSGVQVRLIQGADGRGNWGPQVAPVPQTQVQGQSRWAGHGDGVPRHGLPENGIEISDGTLTWEDRASGRRLVLGGVQAQAMPEGTGPRLEYRATDVYGGGLAGTLHLNRSGALPRFTLDAAAQAVQVGPLLADLTGSGALNGPADLTLSLAAAGADQAALARDLAGRLVLRLRDGALAGLDLLALVEGVRAAAQGRPAPVAAPAPRILLDELSASATLGGGVLRTDDLTARGPWFTATGAGALGLADGGLEARLVPVLVRPPEGRGLKELEGLPIPILVGGTLAAPAWRVDLATALRGLAGRRVQGRGGLLEQIERRTGIKGLDGVLRGLLGR